MTTPFLCVVDAGVAVKLYLAEPLAAEAVALFGLLTDPVCALVEPCPKNNYNFLGHEGRLCLLPSSKRKLS